jgi:hypothetical protein
VRRSVVAFLTLLAACRHAPAPTGHAAEASVRCTTQRAENRRVADASRCGADEDCVQAGRYETGACDAWVTRPDALEVLRRMRVATDDACRDPARIVVVPACLSLSGACISGRCTARLAAIAPGPRDVVAMPEEPRCVVEALARASAERDLPQGRVELRFPLAVDGSPPRWFEAVGPVDPDAAAAVARAFSTCRWRLRDGGEIPPGTWGTIAVVLGGP